VSRLDILIRVQKRVVDDARLALARAETVLDRLLDEDRRLDVLLGAERAAAARSIEAAQAFQAYVQRIRGERDALAVAVRSARDVVRRAADEVLDAHRELRKVELVQDAADERARQKEARRERRDTDDLALARFARSARNGAADA
jgi:flagellar export protein FliJ